MTVNDGVITYYDIDQRMLLLEALGAGGDLRELAVEQLTEDRVKVQAADELGIELPEGAVEAGLEEFATTARPDRRGRAAACSTARGIDRQTMDDFVESGLVWREVVRRPLPRPRDADRGRPRRRARARAPTQPVEMLTLAEIALPFAERGEAETQALADEPLPPSSPRGATSPRVAASTAAARPPQNGGRARAGARRPPAAGASAPRCCCCSPGQVTRPVPISGGLAIIKLVSIPQVRPEPIDASDPAVREELRQQLFTERITSFGQGYLQELLGDALIVER